MQDLNVSNNLRQLSLDQVKALEYSRYDINIYRFRRVELEVSRPLAATTNIELVTSGEDATSHVTDYYDILQNIVEYTFGGDKELKVVFFQCDWFDPMNVTRMDDFGMVEVKHKLCYSGSNLFLMETGGETPTVLLLKEIKNYINFTQIYKKLEGSHP
jgi:hypothetical protein